MGELAIQKPRSERERRAFTRAVVHDIRALERCIARDGIETGITRVGAEQEMYLVDREGRPVACAVELLQRLNDARFTTELARFNLEANLDPHVLEGEFLAALEAELGDVVASVNRAGEALGARVMLTGILPTLRDEDLGIASLTPELRYEYLNEAIFRDRGAITVVIDGIDQFEGTYDSVVLEAANTSLQLHLQIEPAQGAALYNLMQLVTAPLLAAATNSPVLLGRRLWHETRIAVFERSLDNRSDAQVARGSLTRVCFGDAWVKDSIVEIFHDNLSRFPVILTRELVDDPLAQVERGEAPTLAALSLHNGTVWRWNRPCYGVAGGVAHLRLENRVLPAGPTIRDEVANAALFYGMMSALPSRYGDVSAQLEFADARENFLHAAREGLDAEFTWPGGARVPARELLLDELIPAAREGLSRVGAPDAHIERYLGTIEARVTSGQTGSSWLLGTFARHRRREPHEVWADAVGAMLSEQASGRPVHQWLLPGAEEEEPRETTVGDVMTRNLYTLRPGDVVDLASSVMEWKHIRHIPVENDAGELVGLVTAREIVCSSGGGEDAPAVEGLMRSDMLVMPPDTPLSRAVDLILETEHGCVLVVAERKLLGIVTERDLLEAVTKRWRG